MDDNNLNSPQGQKTSDSDPCSGIHSTRKLIKKLEIQRQLLKKLIDPENSGLDGPETSVSSGDSAMAENDL